MRGNHIRSMDKVDRQSESSIQFVNDRLLSPRMESEKDEIPHHYIIGSSNPDLA